MCYSNLLNFTQKMKFVSIMGFAFFVVDGSMFKYIMALQVQNMCVEKSHTSIQLYTLTK